MTNGELDEALLRLHETGPEFAGWLSNHGPMVAEAMVRRGHGAAVHRWLDGYLTRLDQAPLALDRIEADDWREALGDPTRLGDWRQFLLNELTEQAWPTVLATWWPRLLPGIAASATHGVIRTGHAVQGLRSGATPARVAELGHALAYWAARWQPVPTAAPVGALAAASALAEVPRVPRQDGGINARLEQLGELDGFVPALAALRPASGRAEVATRLAEVVAAATRAFLTYERDGNIMLIHAATAPAAVLRTLPALPAQLWQPSLDAAWAASAALVAAYAGPQTPPPAPPEPVPDGDDAAAEVFARAVEHGDEHVVKFADTAADVHFRDGDPAALAAALWAVRSVPG
ncbi:MAG: questin oxidase family protein [Micromonosporaceae bacterium]